MLDCFLLNNMEEIRFGDSLVNLQQKYQQVLFMVLEKHSANTTSLRKHDELFQDLNQENIEYVSNRINSYKPVPNVLENSKVVHAAEGKMRVLVVDDGPDIQMIIRAYFKKVGLEIDTADNGLEAYEMVTTSADYDVILMDLQMPVMNGLDATKKIREWENKNKRLPISIIALTAASFKEDIDSVYAAGCDFHLAKPMKKINLLSRSLNMPNIKRHLNFGL